MTVADTIEQKLREALSPSRLEVTDDSHKHAGHAGARPQGETHFSVEIATSAFEGKNRVERQRMVYGLLTNEMATDIHALALKTLTPDEDDA